MNYCDGVTDVYHIFKHPGKIIMIIKPTKKATSVIL